MNVSGRLATFFFAAMLALGAGAAVGAAVGPIDDPDPAPTHERSPDTPRAPGLDHRSPMGGHQ
jgi:hypothetical protein